MIFQRLSLGLEARLIDQGLKYPYEPVVFQEDAGTGRYANNLENRFMGEGCSEHLRDMEVDIVYASLTTPET